MFYRSSHKEIQRKLDLILKLLVEEPQTIRRLLMPMFDTLAAEVQSEEDATDAMTKVLTTVKADLDAALANSNLNAADKAQFQSISDSLAANTPKVVAATLANTPADPNAPTPQPAPAPAA